MCVTVTLNNTATIDVNGNSVSYAYGIGNGSNGTLVVQSSQTSGVLDLQGTNTYTGNTIVKSGTLQLDVASLYTNSTVSVSNSALLKLTFTGTNQVAALVLNGTSQTNGVYGSSNSSGLISGAGYIRVGSVPTGPTGPGTITNSVSSGQLNLSWPAGQGWILQAQTNSLATGLGTNWTDVPNSSSISSTNIPINTAQPTVFYRLIYRQ